MQGLTSKKRTFTHGSERATYRWQRSVVIWAHSSATRMFLWTTERYLQQAFWSPGLRHRKASSAATSRMTLPSLHWKKNRTLEEKRACIVLTMQFCSRFNRTSQFMQECRDLHHFIWFFPPPLAGDAHVSILDIIITTNYEYAQERAHLYEIFQTHPQFTIDYLYCTCSNISTCRDIRHIRGGYPQSAKVSRYLLWPTGILCNTINC